MLLNRILLLAAALLRSGIFTAAQRGIETDRGRLPFAGSVTVDLSKSGQLATLTLLDSLGALIPIARSYDGRPWEVAPGPFVYGVLTISCGSTLCSIDLSKITRQGSLKHTVYSAYIDPASDKGQSATVARFLEQAT
jgi:hypothetical protein